MRYRFAALMLGLASLCIGSALSAGESDLTGRWFQVPRREDGFGESMELKADGQIRFTLGVEVGLKWEIQKQVGDHYVVNLVDPRGGSPRAVELEVVKAKDGRVKSLLQIGLPSVERKIKAFGKRTAPDEAAFVGTWIGPTRLELPESPFDGSKRLAFFEFTKDGWFWQRTFSNEGKGTFQVEGDRLVIDWGHGPPIPEIRIEGNTLKASRLGSKESLFVRYEEALTSTFEVSLATATVELLTFSPNPRTLVTQESVLVADLKHCITKFEAGKFFVMAQVEMTGRRGTTLAGYSMKDIPMLREACGRLRMSVPLGQVLTMQGIARPLKVWFFLNVKGERQGSRILAKAGPITYRVKE